MLYVDAPTSSPLPPSDAAQATSDTPPPPHVSLSLVGVSVPNDDACAAAPVVLQDAGSLEPSYLLSYLQPAND